MKKILILVIGMALVLASSCSRDPKTPATPSDPVKPADPAKPADSVKPTVKELLQNFPVTFEEYVDALQNKSNRSASRSVEGAVPLEEEDLQGFSSNAYGEMGDGAASILVFIAVFKNDIATIDGINLDEAYTVPENFSVSQKSIDAAEKLGYTAEAFDDVDFGSIKVINNENTVSIYWSLIIRSYPSYMLVKAVKNEDGTYEEIRTYVYQNFGYVQDCMIHYFKEGNKYLETVDLKQEDYRERFISFEENNNFEYYYFDSDDLKNFVYKNAQCYADYNSSDKEEYCIYDENGYVIAYKGDSDGSYYIPLKFIETNGKTITRKTDGGTQYYYIGNSEDPTTHIVNKSFPNSDEDSDTHPAYILSEANLTADGFTYTKEQTFTSATQKLDAMNQTYNSSILLDNFISDTEFNAFKTECTTWVNGL